MSKVRRTWMVPLGVTLLAVLAYFATQYKIEAAAKRHALAVTWEDKSIASVRCARFSNKLEADNAAFGKSTHEPEYTAVQNGGKIKITELLSGFNHSEILHAFVVAELMLSDGTVQRVLVPIARNDLKNGTLTLSTDRTNAR